MDVCLICRVYSKYRKQFLERDTMTKVKALDRAGRKRTIILWFAIRVQNNNELPATSYAIARGLGLSASSKLRLILNEMVSDGLLSRDAVTKTGRWNGSGYMLAEGTYGRPSRSIKVKSKGVPRGQLEMFK